MPVTTSHQRGEPTRLVFFPRLYNDRYIIGRCITFNPEGPERGVLSQAGMRGCQVQASWRMRALRGFEPWCTQPHAIPTEASCSPTQLLAPRPSLALSPPSTLRTRSSVDVEPECDWRAQLSDV